MNRAACKCDLGLPPEGLLGLRPLVPRPVIVKTPGGLAGQVLLVIHIEDAYFVKRYVLLKALVVGKHLGFPNEKINVFHSV